MSTSTIRQLPYGYERELSDVSHEEAINKVTLVLQDKGFGVLTEIDVKATMKKKLDKDYPKYKILGACNAKLADRALSTDTHISLLMPCNVVVREAGDKVLVSIMNPQLLASVSDDKELHQVATEAEKLVKEVLEEL